MGPETVLRAAGLIRTGRVIELRAGAAAFDAFVVQPLKIEGATGSTVVPVAIY